MALPITDLINTFQRVVALAIEAHQQELNVKAELEALIDLIPSIESVLDPARKSGKQGEVYLTKLRKLISDAKDSAGNLSNRHDRYRGVCFGICFWFSETFGDGNNQTYIETIQGHRAALLAHIDLASKLVIVDVLPSLAAEISAPEILRLQNVCALGKDLRMVTMLGATGVPQVVNIARGHWVLCQNAFRALRLNSEATKSFDEGVQINVLECAETIKSICGRDSYHLFILSVSLVKLFVIDNFAGKDGIERYLDEFVSSHVMLRGSYEALLRKYHPGSMGYCLYLYPF